VFEVAKHSTAHDDPTDVLAVQHQEKDLTKTGFEFVSRRQETFERVVDRKQGLEEGDGSRHRHANYERDFFIADARNADQRPETPASHEQSGSAAGAEGSHERDVALAAREAALAEWSVDYAAPKSEPESSPSASRNRRALALAVVLTLGTAPLGRVLRRRAPEMTAEQRPPRRRARYWKLF
jgi:hypothetical protein